MVCSECGTSNPAGTARCQTCDTPLPDETVAATRSMGVGWSAAGPGPGEGAESSLAALQPGALLGDRYEILQLLGQGGMGAVYKARDRELDRVIAVKVIRPELAGQPEILQRFKQEIILARKVTHKNVIRIFDLGQADGIKFITMDYIEGRDLKSLLESRRKFSPGEAAAIIQQVCLALDAAHSEGVVHRDLKPSNILLDANGKVTVMDFGIAHSMEIAGITRTGQLIGTPEYMSPEQAMGQKADARSDIFSLGLIFYKLLTGKIPFEADTALGTLVKRTQEHATPPTDLDPSVPKNLNAMVVRCLAKDPADRYQSVQELLRDLEAGRPAPRRTKISSAVAWRLPRWLTGKRLAVAAAVVVLAIAASLWKGRFFPGAVAPAKLLSVLVADFTNDTADPVFDGTLEPAFNVAIEGASFITAYRREQARRVAEKLQPGAARFDESLARLVAVREGINVVISGVISRQGERYGLAVRAVDAVTGKPIVTREAKAVRRDSVLREVARLAAPVRSALGDTTPESAQLAAAETFTASSLDAAHIYSAGQDLLDQGKSEDAIRYYLSAVQLDPNLGRAYAGLAVASVNLKREEQAAEYYKKVLSLLDRMSEREKYRTLGTYHAAFLRNYPQAIEAYRKLVFLYPGDGAGWNNLSIAYVFTLNIPEAVSASRRALEINPRSLQFRLNFALYSMYAGDFGTAVAEAQKVLRENPSYEFAYLPLGLSTLAQGNVQGARDIYARFTKVSPQGFSLGKMAEADLEMYLGRYKEALELLQAGIAADTEEKRAGEMALKYVAAAEARLALGQKTQAVDLADQATKLSRAESVLLPAARVLLQAGQESKVREIAATLENMLQTQTRSYVKLIAGEMALRNRRLPDAVAALNEAQKLHDSWLSHFLLGRAYLEAGHSAEALAEFETCAKRRGETTDLFFADTTTLRYLPPLYYWLGRAQEGTGMTAAARESYQEFLKLRQEADPGDPLVADARRRSGG